MKKYGQADVMCSLVRIFIERQNKLTEEQKKKLNDRCCLEISKKFLSSDELKVKL